MTTKFNLYCLYADINAALVNAGISPAELFATKGQREGSINSPESARVINELLTAKGYGDEETAQALRILNAQIRYSLQGASRMAAVLLNERLPRRLDYRNTPRPTVVHVNNMLKPNGESDWVGTLGGESVDYVSYLVRMAINSDDYSAKLPLNEYRRIMDTLESINTKWMLNPIEFQKETYLPRILSEVDQNGVPVQLREDPTETVRYLHEIIPVVHAISRLSKSNRHPFSVFTQKLPSLLVETLGEMAREDSLHEMLVEHQDLIMDFVPDLILLNEELMTNAQAAASSLSRFHLGLPVYLELHAVLKEQHRIMIGAFIDMLRRFANVFVTLAPHIEPMYPKWLQFFKETNILETYQFHRSRG